MYFVIFLRKMYDGSDTRQTVRWGGVNEKKLIIIFWLSVGVFTIFCGTLHAVEVETLVRDAVNYYRGNASFSVVVMTIHRPGWERTLTIRAWTRGKRTVCLPLSRPQRQRKRNPEEGEGDVDIQSHG